MKLSESEMSGINVVAENVEISTSVRIVMEGNDEVTEQQQNRQTLTYQNQEKGDSLRIIETEKLEQRQMDPVPIECVSISAASSKDNKGKQKKGVSVNGKTHRCGQCGYTA